MAPSSMQATLSLLFANFINFPNVIRALIAFLLVQSLAQLFGPRFGKNHISVKNALLCLVKSDGADI
jgi:hypothetical protein